jgi:anti-anti-sigma factor
VSTTPRNDFHVGVSYEGACVVVRPRGRVDRATSPRLALVLARLLGEGCSAVVLDLGDVTYLRPDRAWFVGEASRLFEQRGGALVVRRPVATVRDVLDAAGLGPLVRVG